MGKMISGAILILTAGILFATRVIASTIIAGGSEVSGPSLYDEIVDSYSYSNQLLTISIILAVIGFTLLVWGLMTSKNHEAES